MKRIMTTWHHVQRGNYRKIKNCTISIVNKRRKNAYIAKEEVKVKSLTSYHLLEDVRDPPATTLHDATELAGGLVAHRR
jgi:hypothetical protein